MKHNSRVYFWIAGIVVAMGLLWFGMRSLKTGPNRSSDPVSSDIEGQFKLRDNFAIRLLAKEPDIINPMTMCVDEKGSIYVTESSTYRYGLEGAPSRNILNPIKRIELDSKGNPTNITVVADGFANPVMGIDVYGNKLYATCLNELFVMDIGADGKLTNRRLLVKDSAEPWNPFGMYRVAVGPDAKLWLAIADHPDSRPVTLTGTDGRTVRLRGQSGGFVRCNPDGSGLEVIVQGFRAPFAFDVDPWGHLWAISNGEGSPNIYAEVIPGMDYGYHSRNVSYAWLAGKTALAPPVEEMGPGANTVALHYYSSMFPDDFWGNIFMANWGSHGANPTNRSIKQYILQKNEDKDTAGAFQESLQESPELFLASNDSMFRPVCMITAPDGGLYLADWHGHDDESDRTGRIFKISYTGRDKPDIGKSPTPDEIGRMDPAELSALLGNKNRFIRQQAQRALVQSGAAALGAVGDVLKNGDAFAAANATWTLTQMNSAEAVQTMALALKHPDSRVRALGLRQLRQAAGEQMGSVHHSAMGASDIEFTPSGLLNIERLATLAAPLTRDASGEVRVEAALALNSPEEIRNGLLSALDIATNERLRYQIAFELGRYGDSASLMKLYNASGPGLRRVALIAAETAINEKTPLAAVVAGWNLALNDQDAGKDLVTQIKAGKINPDKPADRLVVLEWLEEHPGVPGKPLSDFLLNCVQDHDYLVQAAALRTLRQNALHSPDIESAVMGLLHKTSGQKPGAMQLEAIYTLGSFTDIGKPEEWMPWLKDSSKNVAITALRALRERDRKPEFMSALWPAALSAGQRNPFLAEEVRYTFRQSGIPQAQMDKLPSPPVRSADKDQFARSILSGLKGASPQRGKWSFNVTCATCHSVHSGDEQPRMGPNLTSIGAASQPQYLIESVLQPSKVLKTGFQVETIETKDGQVYSGQTETSGQEIIIRRVGADPVKVPMANVKRRTTSHISPMPEGLDNTKTISELADLTAYLLTLKGGN